MNTFTRRGAVREKWVGWVSGALLAIGWIILIPSEATASATVAAGGEHSCAVIDGGVRCWGSNEFGQLGNPAFGDVAAATDVPGLRPGTNAGVFAVAASESHTCAIDSYNGVKCWGENSYGLLGLGDTVWRNAPVSVPGLGGVVSPIAIATGRFHTCALRIDGFVLCWGYNAFGQLGLGDASSGHYSPTIVPGLSNVVAIAAGAYHTCAMLNGGDLKCWGRNDDGQLGIGDNTGCNNTGQCNSPTPVPGLSGASAITAGEFHTCAIVNGGAKCWGNNDHGSIGDGSTIGRPNVTSVFGLTAGVTSLSAGDAFTCAVVNGGVQCWGQGDLGEQGNSARADALKPHALNFAQSGTDTEVSAGSGHACAIHNNQLFCWGSIGHGMLGTGQDNRALAPVPVSLANPVEQIAAGGAHSCAVNSLSANSPGAVVCWGRNYYGQLGDGTQIDQLGAATAIASGVASIATGANSTCAVLTGGGVKCWGYNGNGQLGLGSIFLTSTPTDVPGLSGVASIVVGASHTCALFTDKSVKCWGSNGVGQLGLGDTSSGHTTPPANAVLTGVKALTLGDYHTCALLDVGTIKCWGYNAFGQLGIGGGQNALSPTSIDGLVGITAIAAGGSHTCAKGGGGVYCWGNNQNGQLGLGDSTDRDSPALIPNSVGFLTISAGGNHTCAIASFYNAAACWGAGDSGQLGSGQTDDWASFHLVAGPLPDVASISAGAEHTCAVMTDGTAKCWGNQLYGRLGNYKAGLLTVPNAVIDNDTLFYSRFEVKP